MRRFLKRLLARIGLWRGDPPGWPYDPFAWKPAPRKPRPKGRHSAVALAEPDDE